MDRISKSKAPLGKLSTTIHEIIGIKQEGGELVISRPDDLKFSRAIHGTTRALIANMIEGVTKGYQKVLEIVGVGYRVEQKGKDLNLVLGYSHPIIYKAPEGVTLTADGQLKIVVKVSINRKSVKLLLKSVSSVVLSHTKARALSTKANKYAVSKARRPVSKVHHG
jgi:large subunit ribosomal protein L6